MAILKPTVAVKASTLCFDGWGGVSPRPPNDFFLSVDTYGYIIIPKPSRQVSSWYHIIFIKTHSIKNAIRSRHMTSAVFRRRKRASIFCFPTIYLAARCYRLFSIFFFRLFFPNQLRRK